jgi:hypothetical protein
MRNKTPAIDIPVVDLSMVKTWRIIPTITGKITIAPKALVFGKINSNPPIFPQLRQKASASVIC